MSTATPAPGTTPRPRLRLLGHPALDTPGAAAVPLTLRHGAALLARLADAPEPLGRDALAAWLWPDATASTARARLRRLVHQMHEQLGVALVAAEGPTLSLADAVQVDLRDLRAAIAAQRAAAMPAQATAALLDSGALAAPLDGVALGTDTVDDWLAQLRRSHAAALAQGLEAALERALDGADGAAQAPAGTLADTLLRLDACNETAHAARLALRARAGDAAGVEAAYHACAERLREELGVRPSASFEQAYARALAVLRSRHQEIRTVPADDGHVAYAAWGQGPQTLVILWDLMSNLEIAFEEPRLQALLARLADRYRLVTLDRRGSGLSERLAADPGIDTAVQDVLAVLDHLGVAQAWLFGSAVGGTQSLAFALRHSDRLAGLLLWGTSPVGRWTEETPWGLRPEGFASWIGALTDPAALDRSLRLFAPSALGDTAFRRWYARMLRHASSPRGTEALMRAHMAVDLRGQLGAIRVPTLVMNRRGDRLTPPAAAQCIAAGIPGAELLLLDGDDHFPWIGDAAAVLAAVDGFIARRSRS